MIEYRAPRNDLARYAMLVTAAKTAQQDINAGNHYISQDLVDEITSFLPNYHLKIEAITVVQAHRTKEIREKNTAVEKTIRITRDLWEVLRRRIKRNNEPNEVLTYYQLPLSGVNLSPRTKEQWVALAKEVIECDAEAVMAGYDAITNPSAAELQQALNAAVAEMKEVAPADRNFDEAQDALADLRPQANDLIREVMAALRFNLRQMDVPSKRRIMRTYGATFRHNSGETPEQTLLDELVNNQH